MPRNSIDAIVEDVLDEGAARRLDMRVDLVVEGSEEILHTAGGVWDRSLKAYVGRAQTRRAFRLHPGQEPAARWLAGWIKARMRGQHVTANGEPVFSCWLYGGRRAGKSVLADDFAVTYAVQFPRAIVWIVCESEPDMPEVQRDLEEQLPLNWYRYITRKYTLANGSQIWLKSAHDPEDLKRGRCDLAVVVEGQKQDRAVYDILRPAVADRGGLVLLSANPPRKARGQWVDDYVEKILAGRMGGVVFELHYAQNPHVDHAALETLKRELDDRTFRREIGGERLPPEDALMYCFSPTFNVAEMPDDADDVTAAYTHRHLGAPFPRVHGIDFQLTPHMVAVTARLFRDPEGAEDEPLIWLCDATIVEQGTEEELVDALEAKGYTGEDAIVPDATGDWQDAERVKGRASLDVFRRRGWRKIFFPDRASKRNPPVAERLTTANALLKAASGKRRLFVEPSCVPIIRGFRYWKKTAQGAPDKRSDYSHVVDAATYMIYRLFCRRTKPKPFMYDRIGRPDRGSWEDLD